MKVVYRNAILRDCGAVAEICKEKGLSNPSGMPPKMWWLKALIEKGTFIAAVAGDEVIGFAVMEEVLGKVGYFWMLGVRKEYRGKGIATELTKRIEKAAVKKDLRAIICYGVGEVSVMKLMKSFKYGRGNQYTEYLKFI